MRLLTWPRGCDTFPSDSFVCSRFPDEYSPLHPSSEACSSLPSGIFWGSVFTSANVVSAAVTLHHLGLEPEQQQQNTLSLCARPYFPIIWLFSKKIFLFLRQLKFRQLVHAPLAFNYLFFYGYAHWWRQKSEHQVQSRNTFQPWMELIFV